MSRIASTLLLALAVVAAQQAALLHEIGHGFGHGAPTGVLATAKDSAGAGKALSKEAASSYCEKCFQFAHVCGAVFSSPLTAGFVAAHAQAVRTGEVAELPADPPSTRSRGPPSLL